METPTASCSVCRAGTRTRGTTTITFAREDRVYVFRHVPADVCDNCDDAAVDATATRVLEERRTQLKAAGATTAVCDF